MKAVAQKHRIACAVLMAALAALSVGVRTQHDDLTAARAASASFPERIRQDPGEVAALNLTYGAGGKAHAPNPAGAWAFVSEDRLASSPKFEVIDADGVTWKVKLGPEAQPETAATRFLWAAGYFTDEDYYLAEITVTGLPTLRRGQEFVTPGGVVHGARLERKLAVVKLGDWDWFDNPFVGQRDLNGLRAMMSLLNNWDLKRVNNAIYVVDGERHYAVGDVGATFGNTGNTFTRSKGVPAEYRDSKFVSHVTPTFIDLELHSRPFILGFIAPNHYRERTRMETITRHLPRADVQWLGHRLSLLSGEQIRDGFRAAGYAAGEVETLTQTLRRRIAALEAM